MIVVSVILYVSGITHRHINGCRANLLGMGNGWLASSVCEQDNSQTH